MESAWGPVCLRRLELFMHPIVVASPPPSMRHFYPLAKDYTNEGRQLHQGRGDREPPGT